MYSLFVCFPGELPLEELLKLYGQPSTPMDSSAVESDEEQDDIDTENTNSKSDSWFINYVNPLTAQCLTFYT